MYATAQENPTQRRSVALIGTLVLHGLLLLFFILWKIITPIPPFPENMGGGAGMELSLGFTDLGMGDNTEDPTPEAPAQQQVNTPPPTPTEEALVTSDVDENTAVAPEKKPDNKPKPKPVQTKPTPKPQPTKEQQEQAFKDKLANAWNTKGNGGSGKGNADVPGVAGGDQGTKEGTGIGNGIGGNTGDGIGSGNGISINMKGWNIRKKPEIRENPNVGGKVVMDIWVDTDGRILRTVQNQALSTTVNQSLVALARKAVMESNFLPNPKATGESKGTMTFIFKLR